MTTATIKHGARSDAPSEELSEKVGRRKVEHYFWVPSLEFAKSVGIDMRSLCGVWVTPDCTVPREDRWDVDVVGGLMPLPETDDCKRCFVVLEKALREGRAS